MHATGYAEQVLTMMPVLEFVLLAQLENTIQTRYLLIQLHAMIVHLELIRLY
jgi:hypothetical protein